MYQSLFLLIPAITTSIPESAEVALIFCPETAHIKEETYIYISDILKYTGNFKLEQQPSSRPSNIHHPVHTE